MYPVSARFRAEVARDGHVAVAGLTLLEDGRDLIVTGGSVTEDSGASVRRTLDATVVDDGGLTPLDVSSPLYPGQAVGAWRGVRFPDGSSERVSLGVFLLGKVEATSAGGAATVTLRGEDRSAWVARNRSARAWPVPSGSALSAVVTEYLADRLPGCPPVALTCPDVTISAATLLAGGVDSDPWENLTGSGETVGIVTRAGRRLWFDADGIPTLYDLGGVGDVYAVDGSSLVLRSVSGVDPERAYGRVYVSSSPAGAPDGQAPMFSEAVDPMALPAFARRTYFAQMDAITSQDALDAAAASLLRGVTGVVGSASWTCPPDPSLQAGDLVSPVGAPLLTGTYELTRVVTPLLSGEQSLDTLERR